MKPKVFILTTGGTVGHRSGTDGVAVMDFNPEKLASDLAFQGIDLEFKQVLQKGSMDIGPKDWKNIAAASAEAISAQARGVVILHGTDTMHYTASALSFMLRGLGLPVVLTGAMIPGGDIGSDARLNLRDAIRVAAYSDIGEVCIVFSADAERKKAVIIRGNRARKIHSNAINAFASINIPPLGYVENDNIMTSGDVHGRKRSTLTLNTDFDPNVVLLKLYPGLAPERLGQFLKGASGAVLEGTGIGHISTELHDVVAQFKKPTVVGTQAIYGGERLGMYAVDKHILNIANVIPAGDMTCEAALVKLMWALEQASDVRSIMQTDIAGEISGRPPSGELGD
jgi:glutamyl-tRNA(Gln) amidotransferase subunit D